MRILHFADVHFHESSLEYLREPCEALVQAARKMQPDAIVIAGDLTTERGVIDNSTAVAARTFVTRLADVAITYVLAGNHDLTYRTNQPNNLRAILSDERGSVHPGVVVVDRPWYDCGLAFLPYPSHAQYHAATGSDDIETAFIDTVRGLAADAAGRAVALAVFHGTVQGGHMGDESGAAFRTRGRDVVVPVSAFAGFSGVLCGHLHRPQTIEIPGGIARYPGCVAPLTYGEADFEPTYSVWTVEGGHVQHESHKLPVTHQRRHVEVTPEDWDHGADAVQNVVQWLLSSPGKYHGAMIKLRARLPKAQLQLLTPEVIDAVRDRFDLHELKVEKTEHETSKMILGPGVDRAERVSVLEGLAEYAGYIGDPIYLEHLDDIKHVGGEIEAAVAKTDNDPRYEFEPVELVAENYKQFGSLRVDFADLPDRVGVLGPTGAGKSNLTLALAAALYGGNPKNERGKASASLASVIQQGCKGAMLRLVFDAADGRYRVTRRYKSDGQGRASSELYFERGEHLGHGEYEWYSENAGSSRETQRAIERLVGPSELHYLTRHLRQHGTSHVKMTSGDLADAVNTTLQLDFEARAELAKAWHREAVQARDAAHTRAETLSEQVVPVAKIEQQEVHARRLKDRAEIEGQQDSELLEKLQGQHEQEIGRKARIDGDLERLRRDQDNRNEIDREYREVAGAVADDEQALSLMGDVPDVDALEARVRALADREAEAADQAQRLTDQHHELNLEAASTCGAMEQSRQAAAHARKQAYQRYEGAKRELDRAARSVSMLGDVPCRGERWMDPNEGEMDGGLCPLLSDAHQASADLPHLTERAEDAKRALEHADQDHQVAQQRAEAHKTEVAQQREERETRVRAAMSAAATAAGEHEEAEREWGRARKQAARRDAVLQRLAPARVRKQALREQVEALSVNTQHLTELERESLKAYQRLEELSKEMHHRRVRVREAQAQVVRAEQDLEQCGMERMQRDVMLKEIADAKRERETQERRRVALDYYRRAVERNGIPALLLEQLAPQLEARVNDILEPVGRRLRIETERVTTTGKTRTEVTLSFTGPTTGNDYVPISELSGGEEDLANLALSAGLARVASDMAGTRQSLVVLDEPAAGVSESLQAETLEVLERIHEHVERTVIVTHRRDLAAAFDGVIEVSRNGAGSVAEVVA